MALNDWINKESFVGSLLFGAITSGATLLLSEWKKSRKIRAEIERKASTTESVYVEGAKDLIASQAARISELERQFGIWQQSINSMMEQLEDRDREIRSLRQEIEVLRKQVNGKH